MTNAIVLEAMLDSTAVENSLLRIEQRVGLMVKHSNASMVKMGQNTTELANKMRHDLEKLHKIARTKTLTDEEKKEYQKLQVEIIRTADALEVVIKKKEKLAGISLKTGGAVFKPETGGIEAYLKAVKDFRADVLKDKLLAVIDATEGPMKAAAQGMREDLIKMMKDPAASAAELLDQIDKIEKELADLAAQRVKAFEQKIIGGQAGDIVGGAREPMKARLGGLAAGEEGKDLERRAESLMKNTNDKVREGGAIIKASLEDIFQISPETDEFQTEVVELEGYLKRLENIKPAEVVSTEELNEVGQMNDKLRLLTSYIDNNTEHLDAASKQRVESLKKQAQLEAAVGQANNAEAEQSKKNILDKQRKIKDVVAAYEAEQKAIEGVGLKIKEIDPIAKALQDKKIENETKAFLKDIDKLLDSDQVEVRMLAAELKKAGIAGQMAFDGTDESAEKLLDELKRLRSKTKDVADTFGEDLGSGVEKGSKRAQASLWKLGNAADRVGVRSAGSLLRITDALKSFGPVAIGAAVAIGGIVIIAKKLLEVIAEIAKKAVKAFFEFTKGSVASAQSIEVLDRQLGGLLDNPVLGTAFRDLLLDKSFDVGLDLTKAFSRVVVPLAKDVDEIERAAELAASLAHAFQTTEAAISNAIKQASGGHFRPLIQQFGFTPDEIEKIQGYQETMGQLTGTIKGMGEAVERRGLQLDNFRGSLQFLIGQFDVMREKVQIIFGEPVKDALSKALEKLFNIIDDRKEAIFAFFESLGEAVGNVVGSVSDFISEAIGGISDEDIAEFEIQIGRLSDEVVILVDKMNEFLGLGGETSLVDVVSSLTAGLSDLTVELAEALDLINGARNALSLGGIGDTSLPFSDTLVLKDLLDAVRKAATSGQPAEAIWPALQLLFKTTDDGILTIDELKESLTELGKSTPLFGPTIAFIDSLVDSSEDAKAVLDLLTETEARLGSSVDDANEGLVDQINVLLGIKQAGQDTGPSREEYLKAQEKVNDDLAKMEVDRYVKEETIRYRFARQRNAADLKRSEAREDAETKNIQNLIKLNDDYHFKREQAVLGFDRKEDDIFTKRSDKLTDIDRKLADKRIDIEKKFREKLNDIRAKFDLDAEEAIRRNDAVALLRIRRRMQLELDQAETQRGRDAEAAGDAAQKSRDEVKIWLDRAVRDNNTAEQRKLDDLIAADEKRRAEIAQQYGWEWDKIQENYDRKKELIDLNEQNALDDMDRAMAHRATALDKALEDEYTIIEGWLNAQATLMQQHYANQALLVGQMFGGLGGPYLPNPATEMGFGSGYSPGMGGGSQGLGGNWWMQIPGFTGASGGTGVSGLVGGQQIALPPANDPGGFYNPSSDLPGQDDRPEWIPIEIPESTGGGGSGGFSTTEGSGYDPGNLDNVPDSRQHGGRVAPGNRYNVNERGIEGFLATRAGLVVPHEPMLMSMQGAGGNVNINNSRNVNLDNMNLMDPYNVSPIQRAVTKELVAEEYLKYGILGG